MIYIYNAEGVLVGQSDDDGNITATDPELQEWLTNGVPGQRGKVEDDIATDAMELIPPMDPLFGLALLEHFENINWSVMDRTYTNIAVNAGGKTRREYLNGREYLVAPLRLIVPGVLEGSNGRILYTREENNRDTHAWNGLPLVAYHPYKDNRPVSARDPAILAAQGLGFVFSAKSEDNLDAEGWFDVQNTTAYDRRLSAQDRILPRLMAGKSIELSTGLFLERHPQSGVHNGRAYDYVAKNYKPDHVAVLPDQTGACSLKDGCGVLVNCAGSTVPTPVPTRNAMLTPEQRSERIASLTANCDCWKGGETTLNGLTDAQLLALSAPKQINTIADFEASIPAKFKPIWDAAKVVVEERKTAIVNMLTANVQDPTAKAQAVAYWNQKDLPELQNTALAVFGTTTNAAPPAPPVPAFLPPGAAIPRQTAAPVVNKDAVLEVPVLDFSK